MGVVLGAPRGVAVVVNKITGTIYITRDWLPPEPLTCLGTMNPQSADMHRIIRRSFYRLPLHGVASSRATVIAAAAASASGLSLARHATRRSLFSSWIAFTASGGEMPILFTTVE